MPITTQEAWGRFKCWVGGGTVVTTGQGKACCQETHDGQICVALPSGMSGTPGTCR